MSGIPGQIVDIASAERKLAIAGVSGVRREVNVACIAGDAPLEELIGALALIHLGLGVAGGP